MRIISFITPHKNAVKLNVAYLCFVTLLPLRGMNTGITFLISNTYLSKVA